jgi:hypothetical protein
MEKGKDLKYDYHTFFNSNKNCLLFSDLIKMLPENDIKEGLSRAYLKAICNHAGYSIGVDEKDFGIDLTIKDIEKRPSGRTFSSGVDLNIQIKSTCRWRESSDGKFITYDLKNKNYNDLAIRINNATKRILVVLLLPKEKENWINQDVESLMIKKCAYWYYLGGQPTVEDNDSTTAIKIPKSQVFSIEELGRIMTQIKNGGDLNEL